MQCTKVCAFDCIVVCYIEVNLTLRYGEHFHQQLLCRLTTDFFSFSFVMVMGRNDQFLYLSTNLFMLVFPEMRNDQMRNDRVAKQPVAIIDVRIVLLLLLHFVS